MLRRVASGLRNLVRRSGVERDLDDEIRFHLQARADDLARSGIPRAEAERRARIEFGGVEGCKEDCREARGLRPFDALAGNLRYAVRSLRHTPGVTAVAVLSLALGIGANTAIFSVVNAVLFRKLPVEDPDRLVLLSWTAKSFPERYTEDIEGTLDTDPKTGWQVSPDFALTSVDAIAAHNRVFSDVLAFSDNTVASNVTAGPRAEAAEVVGVSGRYFDALGLAPHLGRLLHPADDDDRAAPVVVLSWPFWRRMMGGGAAAGTVLVVNGTAMTVVGVAPREFSGLQPGRAPDLYVPLRTYMEHYRRAFDYDLRGPRVWWLTMVGRLKPGVTPAQANSEIDPLFRASLGIAQRKAMDGLDPRLVTTPAARGLDALRKEFSPVLALMTAMVAVVLLIACGNVAGLLLARAAARHRDVAVRLSLGASRGRVVGQLLTESALLGVLGGALGLVLGAWVSTAIAAALANGPREPVVLAVHVDRTVLAFTVVVSIASSLLLGLVPALRATGSALPRALTRRSDAGLLAAGTVRVGKILVGAQVALCLLLLVGAGLLIGTLYRLQRVNLGFDPRGLVVLGVQPGVNGYTEAQLATYYDNLQRELTRLPGVRAVGLSQHGLVGAGWSQGMAEVAGSGQPLQRLRFWRHVVSDRFFETIGIPLVAGRRLEARDGRGAPHVVVVNQRFVREYLGGRNPIGLPFKAGNWQGSIVGVVADTKYGSLRDDAPPTAFLSYLQYPQRYPSSLTVQVRVAGDAADAIPRIRSAVAGLDRTVPPLTVRTQEDIADRALFTERTLAALGGVFGALALVLACVGLFGTMSYSVARRTGEIGVRMALGAQRAAVLLMIVRESLTIAAVGIAAGLPLAWMGSRFSTSLLFGVSPHDPATIAVAVVAILSVTAVAGILPALRASRVDPMTALRDE